MPLVARCGSSSIKTITFLIIHRFLSLKVLLLIYLLFKKHCIQHISIWKVVLDLVKGTWHHNFMAGCGSLLWANTYAAFEVGLSLDQGQGVYSGWSDVLFVSSQLRLCNTCIVDVMSSNGNIFRVTGPSCGEITGHRWIPRTNASDAELWNFLRSVPE